MEIYTPITPTTLSILCSPLVRASQRETESQREEKAYTCLTSERSDLALKSPLADFCLGSICASSAAEDINSLLIDN